MQTVRVARELLPKSARHKVQQVIGGANAQKQRARLKTYRAAVAIGTPGRMCQLLGVMAMQLDGKVAVVLDEVRRGRGQIFARDLWGSARSDPHVKRRVPLEHGQSMPVVRALIRPAVTARCLRSLGWARWGISPAVAALWVLGLSLIHISEPTRQP